MYGVRYIPSVHEMMSAEEVIELQARYNVLPKLFKESVKSAAEKIRADALAGRINLHSKEETCKLILEKVEFQLQNSLWNLKPVINATGTVLHTNLGRARLSEKAASHVLSIATGYSNLEYDLASGGRGSRTSIVEELIIKATGAEAALVVNNNAAAVYFILTALAKHKEVLVSRGELVEIGGSFRVSSIMEESGAELVEVGTTNKTRITDYMERISEDTHMIMKVHTSNFALIGFTESVDASVIKKELVEQGKDEIIVYDDLGSGSLYPFHRHGIGDEPEIKKNLFEGRDLISFSGDKLLGGPQAGIIAGKKKYVDALKKHQLARVLRLDKMTLAALEATLFEYIYSENPQEDIPAVRDITVSLSTLQQIAELRCSEISLSTVTVETADDFSKVGGGTMPLAELPTAVLKVIKSGWKVQDTEAFLRKRKVPVIGRVQHDKVLLDMRTVDPDDWLEIKEALEALDRAATP
ncbi:L-seryl-tRNA(Sec) selenium transferase [Alkalicoccus daliensis]|uniref:L-seryl-tRNA(Sec) selenium transferase n=2 Tax=Alkalicoccus daliensis TaxID=745820 RepID=A0A1H0ACJ8_9BACI|nr:L-seryl-tRNA(Sec) selenium transferase [Alkalicoccus daliensis]